MFVLIQTFSRLYFMFSLSFIVGMNSPGWDASLSEHVLKNLRGIDMPFSEKELQDNLNMLEIKLR